VARDPLAFSVRELIARVKAVLRRSTRQASAPAAYRFGDVEVNLRGNEVRRAGRPVDLSAKADRGEIATTRRSPTAVLAQRLYPAQR
jgi:two-component system OmpR family response regulator